MVARNLTHISLVMMLVCSAPAFAQATAGEGRILERRGRYDEAARTYRAVIQDDPTSAAAWLGLERVLEELNQLESMVPVLASALSKSPQNQLLRELELRLWATLQQPDSITSAARRWINVVPGSTQPYRQWAYALSNAGDVEGALAVLEEARTRFGATAVATEMALVLASAGRWAASAEQWAVAVVESRSNIAAAGEALRRVPISDREHVLEVLTSDLAEPVVRRLGAELLVGWGRPEEGWALLEDALSEDGAEAATELRLFADRMRRLKSRDAARARAYALVRLQELSEGPAAEKARLDAAQAFTEAGDFGAARRLLDGLLDAGQGVPKDAATAMAGLIRVTVESGRINEAEERLDAWEADLRPSDARKLRDRIAWQWVIEGESDRARSVLRGDSSVGAHAILGWAALFDGKLRVARGHFIAAGPFAVSRQRATRRTAMLALLQGVGRDSVPRLGEALLWLERADTSRAIDELESVAGELPDDEGRCPILTFAGDVAKQHGDLERAQRLLVEALDADSLGASAPNAEYLLGSVLAGRGQMKAASARLEHMILSFPASALVPEARRLLDRVTGAIPRR